MSILRWEVLNALHERGVTAPQELSNESVAVPTDGESWSIIKPSDKSPAAAQLQAR